MPPCRKCRKDVPEGAPYCPWCGMKQVKAKAIKQRGNGMGTAFKRGRTWTARVTMGFILGQDGRMKRVAKTKGGFRTKTEALDFCKELRQTGAKRKAPILAAYWSLYSTTEMDRLSDSKQSAYTIAWNKLSALAAMPVDTITVADLRQTVSAKCPTYYTARDAKVLLTHLFKLAAAEGHANKDLPEFINLPENNEKEKMPFTAEEQALLWAEYDRGNMDAAIPLIMIYTGMMPGEMLNLCAEMIDLDARIITDVGMKTKIRKKLSVVLPDAICPVLEDVKRGVTGLIYPMHKTTYYERYYAALSSAGITRHLTPYSCRHTTATEHAITEGMPPQIVARIMRWSSSRMMDRYVHPSDADAISAANAMKKTK